MSAPPVSCHWLVRFVIYCLLQQLLFEKLLVKF